MIKIKYAFVLLIAGLLLTMPLTVFAQTLDENNQSGSAVISAAVPSSHTLTVVSDGAQVFFNGIAVNDTVSPERQSTPQLLIRADSGRKITSVTLDGEDVTNQLVGGRLTLPKVISDGRLIVLTAAETVTDEKDTPPGGNPPQTGDNSNIYLWMILLALSGDALIILFAINRNNKKTIE